MPYAWAGRSKRFFPVPKSLSWTTTRLTPPGASRANTGPAFWWQKMRSHLSATSIWRPLTGFSVCSLQNLSPKVCRQVCSNGAHCQRPALCPTPVCLPFRCLCGRKPAKTGCGSLCRKPASSPGAGPYGMKVCLLMNLPPSHSKGICCVSLTPDRMLPIVFPLSLWTVTSVP